MLCYMEMSELSLNTESASETPRNTTEIPSGYYRYREAAQRLQVEHTGSPDRYLDETKEQEFAQIIEAARFAEKGLAELTESDAERAMIEREKYEPLFEAASRAERTLVETNLRFAAYYARASMNILSPTKDGTGDRGQVGAYGDITRLRSRYADVEDRTQVANLALIKAAKKFTPKIDAKGRPMPFLSFAKFHIHNELGRYVKTEETPGWYVNGNQMDKLYAAQKATADTDPFEYERLREMDRGRFTVPIDEVTLFPEELDGSVSHEFDLADIVADINGSSSDLNMFYELREDQLTAALGTLGEREGGVLRLRFGLEDGTPRTMDEVGKVYGVTKERIRQIEARALSKLRHVSRSKSLRGYTDLETDTVSEAGPLALRPVVPGVANLRTSRSIARKGAHLPEISDEELSLDNISFDQKEPWQALPDEPWDLQPAQERLAQTFEQVKIQFELLLHNTPTYAFQHSFAKEMRTSYPTLLVETINEQLGDSLTSSHIEDFWNHNIADYMSSLEAELGDDFNLDRVSSLFSRLLAERMRDDDRVELLIPTELDGKLNGLGAGLQTGELILRGNIGDFTGHRMAGVANIIVHGSVGDFAATQAAGFASLEVIGNAGHFAGSQLTGSSSLHIHGNAGDFCGQRMRSINAFIGVDGDAGEDVGEGALQGVIEIRGTGYSAHPGSAAFINGDFVEWHDTSEQVAVETTVRLGQLAITHPDAVAMVEKMLRHRPKDPEVISAKIDAVAGSIDAALLEHATRIPMQADRPPERLLFEQACAWFGLSAEELNEYLEEVGHPEGADLMSSDIETLTELYPELDIEMTQPDNGYTSIESLIKERGIRETSKRLLRFFIKNGIPLYEFRDVDGRVKFFISDENLA